MKVRRRPGKSINVGIPGGLQQQAPKASHKERAHATAAPTEGDKKKATIFFGGNTGTCEAMAHSLQTQANEHGIELDIKNLDAATEGLSKEQPAVIITATYEGLPPENAK
jgi:cytochrome P450 / NADPH-cytochrome P450 reductase